MAMLRILSFVTHPEILPVLDRVVNKHEHWTGERAPDLPTALTKVAEGNFDVVLLGSGTGVEERQRLQELIAERGLQTVLIDHFGGGSGLLYAEVMEAVGRVD